MKFPFGKRRPYWAQVLSSKEFEYFQTAVRGYFDERSTDTEFDFEEGKVEPRTGALAGTVLGLHNLVLECAGLSASQMQEKCGNWFGQFFDILHEQARYSTAPYEEVQDSILVRIFGAEQFQESWTLQESGWVLPGNMLAMPVFNLSNSVMGVSADRIKEYGMTFDDVMKPAVARTIAVIKERVPPESIAGDAIVFYDPTCVFVSSGLLDLPALVGEEPELGFAALIPARSTLIVVPLKPHIHLSFVETLRQHAQKAAEEEAGGGCDTVFWVHKGVVLDLDSNREALESQLLPLPANPNQ